MRSHGDERFHFSGPPQCGTVGAGPLLVKSGVSGAPQCGTVGTGPFLGANDVSGVPQCGTVGAGPFLGANDVSGVPQCGTVGAGPFLGTTNALVPWRLFEAARDTRTLRLEPTLAEREAALAP
jgi:hypothetical protein